MRSIFFRFCVRLVGQPASRSHEAKQEQADVAAILWAAAASTDQEFDRRLAFVLQRMDSQHIVWTA